MQQFIHVLRICSLIVYSITTAEASLDCVEQADNALEVCLERVTVAKAGDNVTLEMFVKELEFREQLTITVNSSEPTEFEFAVHIQPDWTARTPDQVSVVVLGGKGEGLLLLQGTGRAGRTLVSLHCDILLENNNTTTNNNSCPLSEEMLHFLQREVSFVYYLELNIVIRVIGWIYCIAWIIGFYPQIILNCQRRSVVGLNFDFLALNLTGGLAYAMFNIGLFWIPQVKFEYFIRHPAGVNPVLLNDVVFSINAAIAQAITIFQCFILKRENQMLSCPGVVFLIMLWLAMLIPLGVSALGHLAWLDYLYIISYVKLVVTPIKYIPQVCSNFKHKSTEGLSVGYVLLEIVGGTFSILQMVLLAYNFDDWKSIFGDPTKFGLGMISIVFDLIFLLQHYVLYRGSRMREHALDIECKCSCGVDNMHLQCKCIKEKRRRLSNVVALPDHYFDGKIMLKNSKIIV